jgi:putative membrane protein
MTTAYEYATLFAHANGDWHPGPWGPLMLLFWAGVIGAVVWFVTRRRPRERSGAERASDILAERYARGELSAEEYRERLEQLR